MRSPTAITCLCVALVPIACGDDASKVGDVATLVSAFCEVHERCGAIFSRTYPDHATCVAILSCDEGLGRVANTPSELGACIRDLEGVECIGLLDDARFPADSACRRLRFSPESRVVELGEACDHDEVECAPDTACDYASETSTCVALPRKGAACDYETECASGTYCAGSASETGEICVAFGADGTSCESHGECVSGFCRRDDEQISEKCAPMPKRGSPCRSQYDCGNWRLWCVDGACADPFASEGEACREDAECLLGLACEGTCKKVPAADICRFAD